MELDGCFFYASCKKGEGVYKKYMGGMVHRLMKHVGLVIRASFVATTKK